MDHCHTILLNYFWKNSVLTNRKPLHFRISGNFFQTSCRFFFWQWGNKHKTTLEDPSFTNITLARIMRLLNTTLTTSHSDTYLFPIRGSLAKWKTIGHWTAVTKNHLFYSGNLHVVSKTRNSKYLSLLK